MSDDWARRTFERLQETEQKQRHEEELELQRRKVIVAKAPLMWRELREAIIWKANELNKYFGEGQEYLKISDSNALECHSPKGKLLLEFKPDIPTVECTYVRTGERNEHGQVSFTVKQGEVVWGGFGGRDSAQETAEF